MNTTTHSQHTEPVNEFEHTFKMFARVTDLQRKGDEASKAEAELARREGCFGTDPGEAANEAWSAYWGWVRELEIEITRLRAAAASTTASVRESNVRQIEEIQEKLKQRDQEIQGAADSGYSLELKRIAIELRKEARDWHAARTICSQVVVPHTAPAEAHQEQDTSASRGSPYKQRGRKPSDAPAQMHDPARGQEAEPKADDEQTHQGQAAEMPLRKRAAIINSLGRRYPALESALNRGEAWAKECRVPKESSPDGKQGWYYLERIEDQCRARYGATAPAPVVDLSPAGQLHRIGK